MAKAKAKQKTPENIEWVVTGRAIFIGATCIVHAKTREEAVAKATSGDCIGEVEIDCASLGDFSGARAEPSVCD